jgi:hypothetical protein
MFFIMLGYSGIPEFFFMGFTYCYLVNRTVHLITINHMNKFKQKGECSNCKW